MTAVERVDDLVSRLADCVDEDESWFDLVLHVAHDAFAELAEAGIASDADYLAREQRLSREMRMTLGRLRFDSIVHDRGDPCAIARAAPPWLRERAIASLKAPKRIRDLPDAAGIVTVADLDDWSRPLLMGMRNFGAVSVRHLVDALHLAMKDGPPVRAVDCPPASLAVPPTATMLAARPMVEWLHDSLDAMPARARDIVQRRFGVDREVQTLEAIGSVWNLSRERARQLAIKALKELRASSIWISPFVDIVRRTLTGMPSPLTVKDFCALHGWLAGMEAYPYLVAALAQQELGEDVFVLDVEGVHYLAPFRQIAWGVSLRRANSVLRANDVTPDDVVRMKFLAGPHAPAPGEDWLDFFVGRLRSTLVVTSKAEIVRIVETLPAPAHFLDVAAIVRRANPDISSNYVHAILGANCIQFSYGRYGCERHLLFSETELAEIARRAAAVVMRKPDRQWTVHEIEDALCADGFILRGDHASYMIDYALERAGDLVDLGRQTWAAKAWAAKNEKRADMRAAILDVLVAHGAPMHADEILNMVRLKRGVSRHTQPFPAFPVIRLGRKLWGINDRDLDVKLPDQPALLDRLASAIVAADGRLPRQALAEAMSDVAISEDALICLAVQSKRFRVLNGDDVVLMEEGSES